MPLLPNIVALLQLQLQRLAAFVVIQLEMLSITGTATQHHINCTHSYGHRHADTLTHSHPVLDYAKHLHFEHEAAARLVVDCISSGGTGELSKAYQSIRCLLSRLCYYCCSCRCTCRSISICICAPETTLNAI